MKLLCLSLLCCAPALAQSDLFDKAPPAIDEALRGRVTRFYHAHVTGKFREALPMVADDSMDEFLSGSRESYTSCEIGKINYSDSYTKATVTMACKGEYRWHGTRMPVTIPVLSTWKFVDGEWWWYHIHSDRVMTPWGISSAAPDAKSGKDQASMIPPDPMAAAVNILNMVAIDKNLVELKSYEAASGQVQIMNNMPGNVTVSVDKLPLQGLNVKIDNPVIPSKGKATVTFSYDPNDPSIKCSECTSKVALPTQVAQVRISPTTQVFPVTITFAIPPELQKLLPKPAKPRTDP